MCFYPLILSKNPAHRNENVVCLLARVKNYMLEKSRVVHHGPRERNFHSFYALLVGAPDEVLELLYIKRGDRFR